jgi:catechol 2,3-dioxygenase-like lactoylglutathione lyase family enzyme
MSLTKIHHIGLVNADLENAWHILVNGFGLSLDEHRTPWPGKKGIDGSTILEFPIGEMYYEIAKPAPIEPFVDKVTGGTSAFNLEEPTEASKFLESTKGRGGIHYISIASNDIKSDVEGIISRGGKIDGEWDGESPIFLDNQTALGLRIQIVPDNGYFVHPYFKGNGNCTGMAHIGIAALDPEASRGLWGHILGLSEDKSGEHGQDGPDPKREIGAADDPVHLLEFPIGGTVIEISHPTTSDSGTARLVASRAIHGAVYHHTAPFTPDVHKFVDQAVEAGMEQIGSIPPKGSESVVIGWFHPRACLGMLLEPWNRPPGDYHYSG